jgi:hypothetical protein
VSVKEIPSREWLVLVSGRLLKSDEGTVLDMGMEDTIETGVFLYSVTVGSLLKGHNLVKLYTEYGKPYHWLERNSERLKLNVYQII